MQGARVGVKLTPQGDQSVSAALFQGNDSPGQEKYISMSRPTPRSLSTASALPCDVHGKRPTHRFPHPMKTLGMLNDLEVGQCLSFIYNLEPFLPLLKISPTIRLH